jgi:hypothetical protein
MHRGGHAIHVHTGGIGRHLGNEAAILIVGLKLQFTPARHDLGVKPQRAAETFGRGHCLLRGLPVDEKNASKSEDEIGSLL